MIKKRRNFPILGYSLRGKICYSDSSGSSDVVEMGDLTSSTTDLFGFCVPSLSSIATGVRFVDGLMNYATFS